MTLIWILSLTFLGAVGIYASVLDIWKGVVRNRVLGWGALAAAVLDAVHYGLLAPNLFWAFCLNVSLMMGIACILFFPILGQEAIQSCLRFSLFFSQRSAIWRTLIARPPCR